GRRFSSSAPESCGWGGHCPSRCGWATTAGRFNCFGEWNRPSRTSWASDMLGVKFCPPPLADNYASPAHTLQRRAHALKLDTELAATLPGEPKFRSRGYPPLKSSFLERRFSNKSNKMCNLRKQSYVLISKQIA